MLLAIIVLLLQSSRVGSANPNPQVPNNGVSMMPGAIRLAYENGLPVVGRLIFPSDVPVRFIEIELEVEDGTVMDSIKSGPNGEFRFDGVKLGRYYIVINAQGIAPVRQQLRLDGTNFGSVRLEIPLHGFTAAEGGEDVVDVEKLKQKIHKDAVKAFEKAEEARRKRDIKKFKSELEKALKIAPDFYEANLRLGLYHQGTGSREEALRLLSRALDVNSASIAARTALAEIHFETADFRKTIDALSEVSKLGTSSADVYFMIGTSHYKLGALDIAEENLLRSLTLSPETMGQSHLQLHNVYLRRRDLPKALEQLDTYLQKFPNVQGRADIQSKADRIRKDVKQ